MVEVVQACMVLEAPALLDLFGPETLGPFHQLM
jgi:hypothetical protein